MIEGFQLKRLIRMNDSLTISDSFLSILKSSILFSAHGQSFCVSSRGDSQFVFGLNSSAETLVRLAKDCSSADQVVKSYSRALEVPTEIARELITIVQDDWDLAGALEPEEHTLELTKSTAAAPSTDEIPDFDQIVFVGCDPVRLIIYDSDLAAVTTPMVSRWSEPRKPHSPITLTAWREGALWHTLDSNGSRGAFQDLQLARDSILTELVKNSRPSLRNSAAIHGATLRTTSGRHIMLSGDSGRGKTTLALGLARNCFDLLSDDISSLDANRNVLVPILMNPSVKEGAWGVLSDLYPELEAQEPVDIKGRLCKYVHRNNSASDGDPHTIDALIFPNWQPGAKASLTPFDGHESLLSMLRWSYLPNDQKEVQAIADFLASIPQYELTYSEFSDAKSVIMELPECKS